MNDLSKRVALITGGSSGIGFEMAKQMVAQKSTVIICGRSKEKLEEAKRKVPQLVTIACDIGKAEDRAKLFEQVSGEFGNLNMLMNNAGIVRRYIFAREKDLEQKIREEWEVNFLAPMMLSQQFLPLLTQNQGSLVNVTSGLAYVPLSIQPSYSAGKAAVHSMTRSLRWQLAGSGVKVVEIFYPAVDTPFQEGSSPKSAMQPDEAAELALKGLNAGKEEIRVKKVAMLHFLDRFAPGRAMSIINNMVPEREKELFYKS